jgi:hypothetical protein
MLSCRDLVWKPVGKCPLVRLRRIWDDNIKMVLKKVGCEDEKCMELAEDCVQWQAVVIAVLNL